ncbi:MAG TPA: hypothetical protein VGN34_05100, partial [Ktedonobacteraceae bacterium]
MMKREIWPKQTAAHRCLTVLLACCFGLLVLLSNAPISLAYRLDTIPVMSCDEANLRAATTAAATRDTVMFSCRRNLLLQDSEWDTSQAFT